MHDAHLHLDYVTRVEGHGHVVLNVRNGQIEDLKFEITESPRFFEAMLIDRSVFEAHHITSRICGICAVGHTLASIKACEDALGIQPSEQTVEIRKLALHGEIIQSHILHAYILAAPDFFGAGSVLPLVKTHPEVVKRALRLKGLANDLCAVVTGRHVHPIRLAVGGVTKVPTKEELVAMLKRMQEARQDIEETIKTFKSIEIPAFERKTEYLALQNDMEEYPFYDGRIASSLKQSVEPGRYKEMVKEFMVSHSTAKHAKNVGSSYMVGALARFNLNHEKLLPWAKEAARELGLKAPCYNTFMNTVAQVVEVVHCWEDSVRLLERFIREGLQPEERVKEERRGQGVGAVEVPRGTLYHDYTVGPNGKIAAANCVIPTGQNLENVDLDLRAFVPKILDQPKEKIVLLMEMLVRAYDPCISCSAHLLDVRFVE